MAIPTTDLEPGLVKIGEEVLRQCAEGAQSQGLGNDDYRACGQFYGPRVFERSQRGLHGMAAAMGILHASGLQNAETTAHQVAQFANHLFESESQSWIDPDDLKNVIKVAELLSSVSRSNADTPFAEFLHNLLIKCRNPSDGGWGYYSDDSHSNEIPSSYALIALAPRSPLGDLLTTRKYLWDRYSDLSKNPELADVASTAKRVLILFALSTYRNHEDRTVQDKTVASEIKALWKELSREYKTEFEITEEYHRGDKNHYVRIPWQVYLANALVNVDARNYYTVRFQKLIKILERESKAGGYCYPQGGSLLSTRTNNAVVQLFRSCKDGKPQKEFWFSVFDLIREGLSRNWVRYPLVILLAIIILQITDRFKQQAAGHNPLWIEVIGHVINLFLFWLATTRKGKS